MLAFFLLLLCLLGWRGGGWVPGSCFRAVLGWGVGVFVQDETEAWLVQHSGRLLVRVGVHLSTRKGE